MTENVNPYPDLRVKWMHVSPAIARDWLKTNKKNRKLRQSWIAQYCHDIACGKWGLSESAIIIAANGLVINGQHRLEAVVASATGIWSVVVTGVPADAIFDMDQGKKRSFRDAFNLTHAANGKLIQNNEIAMASRAFVSNAFLAPSVMPTHHDKERVFEKHKEAIRWTADAFGRTKMIPGVHVAGIMAPVARAYYRAKRDGWLDRLGEFVRVMVTGESNGPKDGAAIKLRNISMLMRGSAGGTPSNELYCKAEAAIELFAAGENPKRLTGTTKELFDTPR